jgi:hypothetical protein
MFGIQICTLQLKISVPETVEDNHRGELLLGVLYIVIILIHK